MNITKNESEKIGFLVFLDNTPIDNFKLELLLASINASFEKINYEMLLFINGCGSSSLKKFLNIKNVKYRIFNSLNLLEIIAGREIFSTCTWLCYVNAMGIFLPNAQNLLNKKIVCINTLKLIHDQCRIDKYESLDCLQHEDGNLWTEKKDELEIAFIPIELFDSLNNKLSNKLLVNKQIICNADPEHLQKIFFRALKTVINEIEDRHLISEFLDGDNLIEDENMPFLLIDYSIGVFGFINGLRHLCFSKYLSLNNHLKKIVNHFDNNFIVSAKDYESQNMAAKCCNYNSYSGAGFDKCKGKKRKLIFHAGTPKTGTTSLQVFLNENREILKDNGILYPSNISANTFPPKHQWLVSDLKGFNFNKLSSNLNNALLEVNDDIHTIILSTEGIFNHWWDFSDEAKSGLVGLLDFFDVEFIVWFRESEDFVSSYYRQNLKNPRISTISAYGTDISPSEALRNPWFIRHLDYLGFVKDIEYLFGPKSIKVIKFNSDTIDQFIKIFNLAEKINIKNKEYSENVGFGAYGVDCLRLINRYDFRDKKPEAINLIKKMEMLLDKRLPYVLDENVKIFLLCVSTAYFKNLDIYDCDSIL